MLAESTLKKTHGTHGTYRNSMTWRETSQSNTMPRNLTARSLRRATGFSPRSGRSSTATGVTVGRGAVLVDFGSEASRLPPRERRANRRSALRLRPLFSSCAPFSGVGVTMEQVEKAEPLPGCRAAFYGWLYIARTHSWLQALSASSILERAVNRSVAPRDVQAEVTKWVRDLGVTKRTWKCSPPMIMPMRIIRRCSKRFLSRPAIPPGRRGDDSGWRARIA